MDLKSILTISGKSGLFQIVSQNKERVIVESLLDKTRLPIYSSHRVSSLADIFIFTDTEEKPLKEVLNKIFEIENGNQCIDPKSKDGILREYMGKIVPDYDKSRVYVSDMKKLFSWYNSLLSNNILPIKEENIEKEENKEETENSSLD